MMGVGSTLWGHELQNPSSFLLTLVTIIIVELASVLYKATLCFLDSLTVVGFTEVSSITIRIFQFQCQGSTNMYMNITPMIVGVSEQDYWDSS